MKTKWLRSILVAGIVLAMAFAVSASPSQPGLPFTMDGNSGVITWYSATPGYLGGVVDYYAWQLYLNGAGTALTQRSNTTDTSLYPPAIQIGPNQWLDILAFGTAGPAVIPLGPGHYDLSIYAVDVEDMPTPNSLTQTQHFTILPLTPSVSAVEEVWDPNGTYHITWGVQPGVESAWVEWVVNGTTYNSGWIANSGAFDTGIIDPLYFWDANSISVIVRDTESMLSSLPGTTTINATPWAPYSVTLNVTGAPDWVVNYSTATPAHPEGVDPDYFVWKLYSVFAIDTAGITQGIEDSDKNFAVDFNPVDDSTLLNIYGSDPSHYWRMSIRAFAPDGIEQGGTTNAADYYIPYGTLGITGNVTTDQDANPWVFTVTYHDPYNDYAWGGIKGVAGYLDQIALRFLYDTTAPEQTLLIPSTSFVTSATVGVIELTIDPGTQLTNPGFVNKYNDWRVEATPGIQCQYGAIHNIGTIGMNFETICPPFAAPAPGATYYGTYPPGTQVPEYVAGPYPLGGPVPNTYEQGVTSGLSLTTAWQLPAKPDTYYGNDAYLQSFVEYQDSTAFAGPYSLFSQHGVPWDGYTHARVFGTAPASVTFYKSIVNMQYNNFGDVLGGGSGSFEDVSPDAEIDNWEVDDLNPDPATAKTMVEEPITEAFGNPWTFTFVAPLTPDYDEWQAFLREMTFGPAITVSPWTLSYPGELVTWTVDQGTFESDITPFLPFGDPFGWYRFGVRTSDNTVPFDNDFMDGNNMDPLVFEYTLYDALGQITDVDEVPGVVSIEMLTAERVRASWRAVDHKPFGVFLTNIHYKAQLQYLDPDLEAWIAVDETDLIYPYNPEPAEHLEEPVMHAEFCAGDYDYPGGDYRIKVYYGYEMPMGGWLYDDEGSAMSEEFEIVFEGFAMAAPIPYHTDGILTSFAWTSPDTDPAEPHIMEYQIEVYGANGLEHDETIDAAFGILSFTPAAWWPSGNVYSMYRARIRAVDSLGRTGDWSPLSVQGNFPLPVITSEYEFDIYHTYDLVNPATTDTPMTDRQLVAQWPNFTVAPEGFINWNSSLVTFDFQVDKTTDGPVSESWHYTLTSNTWPGAHTVDVGVEGEVASYQFYLQVLYDGVRLLDSWEYRGLYIIDLQPPTVPTGIAVTVNPVTAGPTFDWDFNWDDSEGASSYKLIIHRLSSPNGAVDATYTSEVLTASEYPNFNPVLRFSDRVYGDYSFEVVAYDGLGNAITSEPFAFAQTLPSLNVSAVAVTTSQITWATSIERVSYDVLLEGDNGLDYMWENVTTSPLAINLETLFPGLNIYTKWTASVRAYDRDGNVGDWYSGTMTLSLPNFSALSFEVYKFDGSIVPVATKMNIRDMFIKWAEYNTIPAGFINWDKTKVTFQLHGTMSGGSTQSIDVSNINNGETNIQVPVGEEGKEIVYAFTVDMFYDGVLVVQNSPITKAPYTIDLVSPAIPTGLAHNILVAPWTFSWLPTGGDTTGYTFELQKIDPVTGLVINDYTLDLTATNTTVNPLELNWSVFGSYRWRVHAYDQFRNTSTSTWALFNYTLDGAIAPWSMDYELVGEENSLWESILEYSNKRTALFSWSVPSVPVIGLNMEQVDYVFELQKSTGAGWVNVKEYSLTWNPTYMESEVTVGITDETTYYRGRVRAEYQTEQTGWIYSNVFAIDLERPEFIEGAEAPSYSSTEEEYPSWLFTWDEATDEEVGLGGFLFVLERLEGDTTHAIAMIDLPVEYEEPEDDSIGAYSFGFEDGTYLLEIDPFEYVETIDGIFRYTVIPYDRLENLGSPIAGQFTSVWSGGSSYGTYPFINLYDNWMGEKQLIGTVNNNTYATITFDIFGLDYYTLEFRLNGTLLVEGTDYRLIDSPYGNDMYYLVLLESVRDMIQADDMGELEIYAYVEEDDIVVQFTVDAFSYIYLNQRTGFGFGRFRPALND